MTRIRFTKDEAETIDSRLSAPDCIAEALTDVYPGDPVPPYTHAEAMRAADRMHATLTRELCLDFASRVERDVAEDIVDGSVFGYFIADALADGDMMPSEAQRWRRAMRSVERKLARAGIRARFPQ